MEIGENPEAVPAVVLAGGRVRPDLQAALGVTNRALAVVNGRTLLDHVVAALQAPDSTGAAVAATTVIGDVPESSLYTRLPDTGLFVDNVLSGLSAYPGARFVLLATADLPFLTREAVADFLRSARRRAEAENAVAVWPVVPVADCYARFPGVQRTALRLREGGFTGGNLMLVRPEAILALRSRIAAAYAARKSPLRLALMLGLPAVLRLTLSQIVAPGLLTIPYLEARVSALVGGPVRAVVCRSPEIATDLDRPADFQAAARFSRTA